VIVEAQDYLGSIKHDVSVSISRVAEFVVRATALVTERLRGSGRWPSAMSATATFTST
jgi:hypothetical protein